MALTYDQLVNQIKSYAQKDDQPFVTMIPYFINMGIERIYREGKEIGLEKVATGNFTEGSTQVNKPSDWNQTVSFFYGTPSNVLTNVTVLFERPYEFCTAYLANGTTGKGPPLFYADQPDSTNPYQNFFIVPASDQTYAYQLVYLQLAPWEAPGNGTSLTTQAAWLFNRAPSLLFYASYLEALAFMANPEQLGVFEKLYARALADLNRQSRQRLVDRTADVEKE